MKISASPDRASSFNGLRELEKKYNLFAVQYDGWSVWRVMRNAVFREEMKKFWPIAEPPKSNTIRVFQALRATLILLYLIISAGQRDLIVKTARSGLRLPVGDYFRDVYFDGLLARAVSYFKIEEINSKDFQRQAASALYPASLDSAVFTFWGRVLGMLFPAPVLPFCKCLAHLLSSEVYLDVDPKWLRMRVSTVYWQSRLYGLLLLRLRPKAALVSDTGDYALNLACKRHGVRFVELQHGVFNAEHPDAIPACVDGTELQLFLPDILACRGGYWIEQLEGTRQGRDHATAVGNELIDLARERRAQRGVSSELRIVVSSQGLDSECLVCWIAEFVAVAPCDVVWHLTIKLHPVYDADNHSFDLYNDSRISVVGGADQPNIFDLLADADMHLSIASACHFDAAALGVPSFVIPLAGHEAMLDAIDGRLIHLARQPSDPWILSLEAVTEADIRRYSEPGFIFNLARLIT